MQKFVSIGIIFLFLTFLIPSSISDVDITLLSTNDPPYRIWGDVDCENETMTLYVMIIEIGYTVYFQLADNRIYSCSDYCYWTFNFSDTAHTWDIWIQYPNGEMGPRLSMTFTFDCNPPTVEFTSPEEGKLYLYGSPRMDRILDNKTLCIGKVPVAANADDGTGSGVSMVLFSFSNGDSGYDDNGSNGFTYTFKGMHFGALTITAVAIDNVGLTSTPDSMTLDVYNLGLI